jgi:cellulose synthase/poly-beta-1,6-N-acetylglucosamine synthase-like glycosyltransferase
MIRDALRAFEIVALVYFAVLNTIYSLFGLLGLRAAILHARERTEVALKDLLERDYYKPVSILVPAYNEARSIVPSVGALLAMQHPEFEVIVVSDGSTDATVEALTERFALVEVPPVFRRGLVTAPLERMLRSLRHPNLTVACKQNGGKADALNLGLNIARYPLVCSVDADSLLDADALLRASRLFGEDESIVAVGGTVRPLNGAEVRDGRIVSLNSPRSWIERFQVLEYARAFFTGRAGWSHLGALLIISGAFGLFRRETLIAAGGYRTDTVGEDMEIVVRMRKQACKEGREARVVWTPDPVCWTEVPSDLTTLRRQRNRWQRGLWETLWTHRDMLGRARYGRLGALGLPYFWLFEGFGPAIEALGTVALVVSWAIGALDPHIAALFFLLALGYGVLLSQLAVGIETLMLSQHPRTRDRIVLFFTAILEFCGYHQLLSAERFFAMFEVHRKRKHWGAMARTGIPSASTT